MNVKKSILTFLILLSTASTFAQNVAISPSRLYYKAALGEYKVQEVTITNNSTKDQSFTVSFGDFEASGALGKSRFMKPGESPNSCSQWLSADPAFFNLEAGKSQKIKVLMQVPATPEANKVKWASMQIKLAKEKTSQDLKEPNAIGLGVTESFQFVIHIFQTPPTVTDKSVEIVSFKEITSPSDSIRTIMLRVNNTGEAILDCVSYLELTNLNNGREERQKPIAYTLLPGTARELKFTIPPSIEDGKYSLLGVVDFGSRENMQAAETEIDVKRR
jgi:P pilus assembly chaperone PapD